MICVDKTVNYIIIKCIKQVQKEYITGLTWMTGDLLVIVQETYVCSFRQMVLANELGEFLCDFEIQTDGKILNKRPNLLLINKNKSTCHEEYRPFQLNLERTF